VEGWPEGKSAADPLPIGTKGEGPWGGTVRREKATKSALPVKGGKKKRGKELKTI